MFAGFKTQEMLSHVLGNQIRDPRILCIQSLTEPSEEGISLLGCVFDGRGHAFDVSSVSDWGTDALSEETALCKMLSTGCRGPLWGVPVDLQSPHSACKVKACAD